MSKYSSTIIRFSESYSLLVKVAESLAQKLIAKIFVKAYEEVAQKLSDKHKNSTSEEEDEDTNAVERRRRLAPQFSVNEEVFTLNVGEPITLRAKFHGDPSESIQWYFNGEELDTKR